MIQTEVISYSMKVLSILVHRCLKDLWNSRRRLGTIEGFDHSVTNDTLGACGELPEGQEGPCLAFYIWQCGEYEVNPCIEYLNKTKKLSWKK